MFVSRKKLHDLEFQCRSLRFEVDRANERYWQTRRELDLLLAHLGLYTHEIQKHTVLRSKGGPEQGPC
jgi:hypothetical protein